MSAGDSWSNPVRHRGWLIYRSDLGYVGFEYHYQHDDVDGAPDSNDSRYGWARSIEEAKAEIDEAEDES